MTNSTKKVMRREGDIQILLDYSGETREEFELKLPGFKIKVEKEERELEKKKTEAYKKMMENINKVAEELRIELMKTDGPKRGEIIWKA